MSDIVTHKFERESFNRRISKHLEFVKLDGELANRHPEQDGCMQTPALIADSPDSSVYQLQSIRGETMKDDF